MTNVVCWALCEGKGHCGEANWHVIDTKQYEDVLALGDKSWCCSTCMSMATRSASRTNTCTIASAVRPIDPFSPHATQKQRDEFFDASSTEWMRNKIRVYNDGGFCIGYKYKTKRMRSLLASDPKRKKRTRRR